MSDETEAMADWEDTSWDDSPTTIIRHHGWQGGDREQPNRWRCLATGCNPVLDEATAKDHHDETGHRVAKWPVRSAEGKRRARRRNETGYYDQYNVGHKAASNRTEDHDD